jgi:outer membrane protein TolC
MLNAALGRPVTGKIPALAFRADTRPPSASKALIPRALRARPELREGRAEIARARAEVDAMESMYAPMAMMSLGPAYTMADGPGLMMMFGVSLPLNVDKNRAGVREARAMQRMAEADLRAMKTMIAGEVASARERLDAERTRLLVLRQEVLPTVEAAVDATLAAFAAGVVPLVSVVDVLAQLKGARLEEVRAEASLGIARARLARASGGTAR